MLDSASHNSVTQSSAIEANQSSSQSNGVRVDDSGMERMKPKRQAPRAPNDNSHSHKG